MVRVKEAIIVEGKYDKIRLSSLVDGLILTTDGFGIFKDKDKVRLLRSLAESRGLLILTDSDSAGFLIRGHLAGAIDSRHIRHVYIPDVPGKERRKDKPSAEGKRGVEGMETAALLEALHRAGVDVEQTGEGARPVSGRGITKLDLYEDGLSGQADSARRRGQLLRWLRLPERLSANALWRVLDAMMTYEQYREALNVCFTGVTLDSSASRPPD